MVAFLIFRKLFVLVVWVYHPMREMNVFFFCGDHVAQSHATQQPCSVTCLVWPHQHSNELVFGIVDGKVRIGNLKTNRAQTLYGADRPSAAISRRSLYPER